MARINEDSVDLFKDQLGRLGESHFLILYWCAQGEDKGIKYNITNCFDDLKYVGITRTKQTAVSMIEALWALCFIDIREERNRKNIYITKHGARALQQLVVLGGFGVKSSSFLEGNQA